MLRRFTHLPLRAKLVAASSALVLALSAVLFIELPRAMDAQSFGWVESRSLGMGQLLADALEAAVDFDDGAAAERALAGLRTTQGAVYAQLIRSDFTILAAWRPTATAVVPPPGTGEGAAIVDGLLRVRVPVATRAGRAADLLLGFDLQELEERRRDARNAVLWVAALFLVVGLGSAIGMGTLLARPLAEITRVAKRVAREQAVEPGSLPVGRGDEIGLLASAFAHMLEQLYAQRGQIDRINADLAERVQERTQELARTSQALAELGRAQEQLVLADRRVSVGRLAAGVAHEINNPMAFLSGNLEFVSRELDGLRTTCLALPGAPDGAAELGQELCDALADCRRGVKRVTHIVKGLKTFARDDDDQTQILPIDGPLEAAIEMAMHEVKHRARLVRDYRATPRVEASEVRLSQVFLNLLMNAAQAIPGDDAERHQVTVVLDAGADGGAVVEISDTGCGMTPEVLRRIFDPFFTTKEVGVGTGLGLPISRNIVQKCGGEITVQSEPGAGTTFRVAFPPPGRARPAPMEEARPAAPALDGVRLLVVDDEPDVARAVQRALSREARVFTAGGGREALERLAQGEVYDAVLCDLMMPGMSGAEFHEALASARPGYLGRLAFMTGGAFTDSATTFLERWRGPLLEKPLDQELLRRTLHDLCT